MKPRTARRMARAQLLAVSATHCTTVTSVSSSSVLNVPPAASATTALVSVSAMQTTTALSATFTATETRVASTAHATTRVAARVIQTTMATSAKSGARRTRVRMATARQMGACATPPTMAQSVTSIAPPVNSAIACTRVVIAPRTARASVTRGTLVPVARSRVIPRTVPMARAIKLVSACARRTTTRVQGGRSVWSSARPAQRAMATVSATTAVSASAIQCTLARTAVQTK